MPLYEYRCTSCGYSFEKIQSFSAEPEKVCPKCQGELIRPVTAPALRFAGAGWYVNDYAGKGGAKSGEPAASGEAAKTETKADTAAGSSETKTAPAAAPATPAASSSTSTTSGS